MHCIEEYINKCQVFKSIQNSHEVFTYVSTILNDLPLLSTTCKCVDANKFSLTFKLLLYIYVPTHKVLKYCQLQRKTTILVNQTRTCTLTNCVTKFSHQSAMAWTHRTADIPYWRSYLKIQYLSYDPTTPTPALMSQASTKSKRGLDLGPLSVLSCTHWCLFVQKV